MSDTRPTVHLLDAHVYIFRAYYSLPEMEAPDGTPTNAAYGYANTLLRLVQESDVTHLGVCFDFSMESFRNDEFPEYKAQRGAPPEDLDVQFEICAEVTRALGIPLFMKEDYEADDCIATLVSQLEGAADVAIVSTDKDLSQLVREDGSVWLYDLAKERTLDADGVRAKFGVDPVQIPDYLGLVGDSVDNLPGVPGVGPKSAAAALEAFGAIEHIPADTDEWKDVPVRGVRRLAGLIEEHRAHALRIRDLATVVREVPGISAGVRDLRVRGAHRDLVDPLFDRLGWGGIRERIPRFR